MTAAQFREQSWRWFRRSAAAGLVSVAACGGSVEQPADLPSTVPVDAGPTDAAPWYPCTGAIDASFAPAQASADETACLQALCSPVSQCLEVTAERPVCVIETNGGQLLDLYACAPGCCY